MLSWLAANLGTLLVLALLAGLVGLIAANMHRERRQGKTSCAHGCDSCAMRGQCHPAQPRSRV